MLYVDIFIEFVCTAGALKGPQTLRYNEAAVYTDEANHCIGLDKCVFYG